MSAFWKKLTSPLVWANLLGLCLVTALLMLGLWFWMDEYTRHGQKVNVPDVKGMTMSNAIYALQKVDLVAVVADSAYNKNMPGGTVLEQTPVSGQSVKADREIYLTVNSQQAPTVAIPDIADNCSLREAQAKLRALGLRLGPVEYVPGDKDWVLDVKYNGNSVGMGERVPIDSYIVLVVGNSVGLDMDGWEEDSLGGDDFFMDDDWTDDPF